MQINVPGTKFVSKTRSSGATLKTKTVCCQQIVFVKQLTLKTLSTKLSPLGFSHWMFCSERAGFTKQNHPSHSLILAVCCETEQLWSPVLRTFLRAQQSRGHRKGRVHTCGTCKVLQPSTSMHETPSRTDITSSCCSMSSYNCSS